MLSGGHFELVRRYKVTLKTAKIQFTDDSRIEMVDGAIGARCTNQAGESEPQVVVAGRSCM